MERDFKGIWIPKEIWLNEDLTLQEKIFLVEIDSLDNEQGCFAGNQYFADFFNLSTTRVSLIIKSLIDKGYITSEIIYKENTKEILKRVLKVCYIPYLTKVKGGIQGKLNTPTQGKLKDNNTFINNTINNTSSSSNEDNESLANVNNKELANYNNNQLVNVNNKESDSKELVNEKENKKRKNDLEGIDMEQQFEGFWKLYPRNEGKKTAKDSFMKKIKSLHDLYLLAFGFKKWLEAEKKKGTDPKFYPHCTSWLNQERFRDYEDEYNKGNEILSNETKSDNSLKLEDTDNVDWL